MFDGFKPEEGRYVLQAAAAVRTRSADDLIGDWAIERGAGKPICALTLANTPAATGGDYLALKLKPGCDAWSPNSAQPRGAWTTANWCCRRRAGVMALRRKRSQ